MAHWYFNCRGVDIFMPLCVLWYVIETQNPHIYVANWFFVAFILTIGVTHIANSMATLSFWKSYSLFGATDAMLQWWKGHNAVGFFNSRIFRYDVLFCACTNRSSCLLLSFIYHPLLGVNCVFICGRVSPSSLFSTPLTGAQSLGMVFSIILFAPSWAVRINGVLTLSGSWDKLRTDPIIRFFDCCIVILCDVNVWRSDDVNQTVNALSSQYWLDRWSRIRCVRLGWYGYGWFIICIDSTYLEQTKMYSTDLITTHFWLATAGTIFYIVSLWISGIGQGMMWRATNPDGTLVYSFVDTVLFSHYPPHWSCIWRFLCMSQVWSSWLTTSIQTITMPVNQTVEVADTTTPVVETATAKQI